MRMNYARLRQLRLVGGTVILAEICALRLGVIGRVVSRRKVGPSTLITVGKHGAIFGVMSKSQAFGGLRCCERYGYHAMMIRNRSRIFFRAPMKVEPLLK